MKTIVFLIIVIGQSMVVWISEPEVMTNSYISSVNVATSIEDPIKTSAFQVLSKKCNVCHSKRNRRWVFSEENMNPRATDVYKQVFVKKRMPKGKGNKLSSEENQILLTWISTLNNR
ncbi:hypothetical protein [Aureisphaera sp.]